MKKNGLEMRTTPKQALGLLLMLMLAVAGCGGHEPKTPDPAALDRPLAVAPLWMAELDLPGCELPTSFGGLLQHPFDEYLVIAVVDGQPGCVGLHPRELTKVDPCSVQPATRIVVGGINPLASVLHEDDPVPIMPETSGEDQGGNRNNDEGTDNADDRPPTPGNVVKASSASDDPVPIRNNKALISHRPLASE